MGSPPQVRGKPLQQQFCVLNDGITPAGAGKTSINYWRMFMRQDHPRRCGENFGQAVNVNVWIGSPPQVRGKLGNLSFALRTIRDHPRRCGEN